MLPLGPAGLDAQGVAVRLELVHAPRLVELGQLEHNARAQAGAEVGGASANVSQVLVVPVCVCVTWKRRAVCVCVRASARIYVRS